MRWQRTAALPMSPWVPKHDTNAVLRPGNQFKSTRPNQGMRLGIDAAHLGACRAGADGLVARAAPAPMVDEHRGRQVMRSRRDAAGSRERRPPGMPTLWRIQGWATRL